MTRRGLIVDGFAWGGGASVGIEAALGRSPDLAMNHDPEMLAMHIANHPRTRHFLGDIWHTRPHLVTGGYPIDLAWFSPSCTYFSKARGGVPHVDIRAAKRVRALAWVATRWAKAVRPRVICVENVEEFEQWGPLLDTGLPDPDRAGTTFRRWVSRLRRLGYAVEWRQLRACDYGAPTIRKRLFIIARCDGKPIVWPTPTHGPGRAAPYRTAAECIDWSIPCPSIFERERPLADKTLARIARGIQRFVLESPSPFIPTTHAGDLRSHPLSEPARTITGAHRGELALISPAIVRTAHGDEDRNGHRRGRGEHDVADPLPTITASRDFALMAPTLIQTGYDERPGQAPRSLDLHEPLGTLVAGGAKHALMAAFLAKHYSERTTGGWGGGAPLDAPSGAVTVRDHHALVTSNLVKLFGSCADGQPLHAPAPTVRAGGTHLAEVRAFLLRYNTIGDGQRADAPLGTITTKDRFGLVTIEGAEYAIVDIGMRMLQPRELFRAQGFPDDYVIDPLVMGPDGVEPRVLTKTAQIRACGNAVPPAFVAAILRANLPDLANTQQEVA